MQLVDISGTEILNEIREIDKEIPVWLMTANDEYNNIKTVSEGFNGLISKPIKISMLIDILSYDYPKEDIIDESKVTSFFTHKINGTSKSIEEVFPQLASMFGKDSGHIKEILNDFVESSAKDTEILTKLVEEGNFSEVQKICHRIHPFLSQLDANHLTLNLIKMDKLRGKDESLYPDWQKDIINSVEEIKRFTESIKNNYL